jgi:signal transduction histidine kinase/DNA-binding response OmpR family regulator
MPAELRDNSPENVQPHPIDFRLLFESAQGLYLVLTPGFAIIAVSDAYLRATMTERDQILGRNIFEVFPDNPDDPNATGVRKLRASLESVLRTHKADTMAVQKYDIRRPESGGGEFEERYWSPVNSPVMGPHGEILYIIHRVEDVTEFIRLKQAGEKATDALLTRSEQMEAEIYRRAQELDETNRQLTAANLELARLYRQITLLMAQADDELRLNREGDDASFSQHPPGVEEMLDRVGRLITGYKHLEEELRQSQKMEAVGQLAGGIAHDFNNVLNVIIGYSELLLQKLPPGDRTYRQIEEICKAGERAAGLTQQLLAFSRKQVLQPRIVDFADILREMHHMVQRVIGENIEISTDIHEDLARVKIDPSQVQQVILNLVVNARDAMPTGGKLTFELNNAELDASYAGMHDIPPGRYVMLSVSDNGCGMTPEVRQRAFEPFFTTKELGSGTGLGLATVYGIVRQSGGHIWLYSEPGIGTTFKIFFPGVDAREERVPSEPSTGPTWRGTETILLVEDDSAVRLLVEEILGSVGYHVLAADDGQRALLAAQQHNGKIDLLLTDVVLPKMGGKEIASRLVALRPGIKVLFMSGYTGHSAAQHGNLDPDVAFLPKPFSPAMLIEKVRSVLTSRSPIRRILVVDDERAIRELLTDILTDSGFQTFTARDGREAGEHVRSNSVDLVITDLFMEGAEGIELIRALRKEHPGVRIIAMSGTFGNDMLAIARALGADATLTKPLSPETLLQSIKTL